MSSSSSSDSDESLWQCSEEELCDYEKKRLENIRRNQQMMRSLGKPLCVVDKLKVLYEGRLILRSYIIANTHYSTSRNL